MNDFASLAGKRLIVTGADSGIGLAFVELATRAGATVAALVHEDSGALDALVPARLQGQGQAMAFASPAGEARARLVESLEELLPVGHAALPFPLGGVVSEGISPLLRVDAALPPGGL